MTRWWGIRHVRWLCADFVAGMRWEQQRWTYTAPDPAEQAYLNDVWSGKA